MWTIEGDLAERVARRLERAGVRPGDGAAIGLSGGGDSVALVHVAASLRRRLSLTLVAVHLDHGLRGDAADGDAAFVVALCRDLGLALVLARQDVAAAAAAAGVSVEMAGRGARRALFDRVRRERGLRWLMLGHHADDQAETLLLRLVRGTGLTGAGAMAEATDDGIVRPFLAERRQDLRAYLQGHGQAWREDATNAERSTERNRMRLDVLPALEAVRPGAARQLARSAAQLGADARLLRAAVNALLAPPVEENGGPWRLVPADLWRRAAADLRGQLLREAALTVAGAYPPAAWIEAWREAPERAQARPDLPWLRLSVLVDGLVAHRPVDRRSATMAVALPAGALWRLPLPDGATIEAVEPGAVDAARPLALALAAGAFLRHPRPSDRVVLDGGDLPLREVLRRRGVPAPCRAAVWLVDDGDGAVAWLPAGAGEAAIAPARGGGRLYLRWRAAPARMPTDHWPGAG